MTMKSPIRDIIEIWCIKENKRTGIGRAEKIAAISAFCIVLSGFSFFIIPYRFISGAALAMFAILFFAVHLWFKDTAEGKLTWNKVCDDDRPVPDSLLSELADASILPGHIKTRIADCLTKDGQITFFWLARLGGEMLNAEKNECARAGDGFKKLAAFSYKGKP
jgi:hypothetical protein